MRTLPLVCFDLLRSIFHSEDVYVNRTACENSQVLPVYRAGAGGSGADAGRVEEEGCVRGWGVRAAGWEYGVTSEEFEIAMCINNFFSQQHWSWS